MMTAGRSIELTVRPPYCNIFQKLQVLQDIKELQRTVNQRRDQDGALSNRPGDR